MSKHHLVCTSNIAEFYGVDRSVVIELLDQTDVVPVGSIPYGRGYQRTYRTTDLERAGFAAMVAKRAESLAKAAKLRVLKRQVATLETQLAA